MQIEDSVALNGTQLHYVVEGDGPPMVLIHGMGANLGMWEPQMPALRGLMQVIRYDMRGFGESGPDREPYRAQEDLAALLDHLHIDRAHILGISRGGSVGVNFAIQFPDRTLSLIAADPVIRGFKGSGGFTASLQALWATARNEGIAAAKAQWLDNALFKPAFRDAELRARVTAMLDGYDGYHWTHPDPELILDPPPAQRLAEILSPTLVVVGELDIPEFLAMADTLVVTAARARKIVLKGVGHLSTLEAPIVFNSAVLDFLDELGTLDALDEDSG